MKQNTIMCPGCGLEAENKSLAMNDRYNSSGECTELFNQLTVYTFSQNNIGFTHQIAVDAYGAQHSGGVTKNITTVFSLIGLCLVVEYGYTGRQVQKVHMKIPKQNWERFELQQKNWPVRVQQVLNINSDVEREDFIKKWAKSVWNEWKEQHTPVRKIVLPYI